MTNNKSHCSQCDAIAVTEIDDEPYCAACAEDWWHDNSITCDYCGAEHVLEPDIVFGEDCNTPYCSYECAEAAAQDARDAEEYIRFESLPSRFI